MQRLAPQPRSRRYTDDTGRSYVHREAPSRVWMPMRQIGVYPDVADVPMEVWQNDAYECSAYRYAAGFPIGDSAYVILGMTHVSQTARHDFRDMMRIKNDVCGADWEAVELYPSESRLVDPSNHFYLWCCPQGVFTWGLPGGRTIRTMAESIAPQRPFPDER